MFATHTPSRLRSTRPHIPLAEPEPPNSAVFAPRGKVATHGMSHSIDVKPSRKKAFFQPNATTMEAISGAPKASPARVPQLTRPEARPRSLAGKRTLTIFILPGR